MRFGITEKPTTKCVSLITLALSLKYPKKNPAKTLKIEVLENPNVV